MGLQRPSRTRRLGLVSAAVVAVGLVLALPSGLRLDLPFATVALLDLRSPLLWTDAPAVPVGLVALLTCLCWLFAEQAARPGVAHGAKAALGVSIVAASIVTGALVVLLLSGEDPLPGGIVPMALMLFVILATSAFVFAIAWVGCLRVLVRIAARVTGVGNPGSGPWGRI